MMEKISCTFWRPSGNRRSSRLLKLIWIYLYIYLSIYIYIYIFVYIFVYIPVYNYWRRGFKYSTETYLSSHEEFTAFILWSQCLFQEGKNSKTRLDKTVMKFMLEEEKNYKSSMWKPIRTHTHTHTHAHRPPPHSHTYTQTYEEERGFEKIGN